DSSLHVEGAAAVGEGDANRGRVRVGALAEGAAVVERTAAAVDLHEARLQVVGGTSQVVEDAVTEGQSAVPGTWSDRSGVVERTDQVVGATPCDGQRAR